ncbi:MAG: flippase-like domain-containing protein [Treponema sp.]|nr:flippase-like domain-containing protein [Treponema sp.]
MSYLYYIVLSTAIITLAHVIRIYRWALFIDVYEKPDVGRLLRSFAIGNGLNMVLPFKLGDLARAWYSGRRMKNGKTLGLSTVIIERYLDILAVGLIFISMKFIRPLAPELRDTLSFYIAFATGLFTISMLILACKGFVKRGAKLVASIFNPTIEFKILKFFWSLIQNFKDIAIRISKVKLILYTVLMWALYLLSYFFFAEALCARGMDFSWKDIFTILFAKSSIKRPGGYDFMSIYKDASTLYIAYMSSQLAIVFLLSFVKLHRKGTEEYGMENKINLLPHTNQEERLRFLELYFSNSHKDYIRNYLRINQDILIIRDYSAGSNATTMLCMNASGQFFRKYAFGKDGEKLYEQVRWLERFAGSLALPTVIRQQKEADFCYYDMPFQSNTEGLFNYAHSMPIEKTWGILEGVFTALEGSLYKTDTRAADRATIEAYIESKVRRNIEKILNAKYLKPLMKYDEILINGKAYRNLPHYLPMLESERLQEVFADDGYSAIHGDLTIENIICVRNSEGSDSFYIIDPNTGNIHDSPNLDYGKLLQSIGGGYEFLMMTQNVEVIGNRINFIDTRSHVYTSLYNRLDDYMQANFSQARRRSIYFHHIIHWLRLMPYKIEKNGIRSALFYAGLLKVLDDVSQKFGGAGQ